LQGMLYFEARTKAKASDLLLITRPTFIDLLSRKCLIMFSQFVPLPETNMQMVFIKRDVEMIIVLRQ